MKGRDGIRGEGLGEGKGLREGGFWGEGKGCNEGIRGEGIKEGRGIDSF